VKLIMQPEAGLAPVVKAIKQARTSVSICIFRMDRPEVEKALAAAVQRGVNVSALVAHTNRGGEAALRRLELRLLAAGATVSRTGDDLAKYHAKYMVVDNVLHVLGFNLTKLDILKSRSFAVSTKDRRSVQEALKLFAADSSRQPYEPARSNLVVSPETSRDELEQFIRGAKRRLSIYDVKVQDPAMVKLLNERAARGVEVRVIGSLKGGSDAIAVRKLGMRLHVRAIVRDGTRAFVGSQSLRKEELDSRREVGLLVNNPTVTRSLMQTFETDWEHSAPKAVEDKVKRKEEKKEKVKEKDKDKVKEKDTEAAVA
jgi:phosphatidylserine/phosphatidylglycerophosphate/cardiolipin synthase-like enzyme